MNEKVVACLVFFLSLYIIGHARFILKIRRLRRKKDMLPNSFPADELGAEFCACLGCCGERAAADIMRDDFADVADFNPQRSRDCRLSAKPGGPMDYG